MVTQHQKALPSSQQPTLNKEDEQSSILRFVECIIISSVWDTDL